MFDADPLFFGEYVPGHASTEIFLSGTYDDEAIVKEAEKAFTKALSPKYNNIKFKSYPKGKHELSKYDLEAYIFQIADDLELSVNRTTLNFYNASDHFTNWDKSDGVQIEGSKLTTFKARET